MADIQQVVTTSTLIHSGAGVVQGLVACISHGSGNGTITLYDNTAASGLMLLRLEIEMDAQPFVLFFQDRYALRFSTGLYATVDADVVLNLWATER